MRDAGVPMKASIEGEPGSKLRQSLRKLRGMRLLPTWPATIWTGFGPVEFVQEHRKRA
jgi:hypothetical protein